MTTELSIEAVRQVQLGILSVFDDLCRSHGLTYYLAYGTLLGAVRHRGYIPWDDDVDVMMPRADYERLPSLFESVPPAHLSLSMTQTRAHWPFPYAKIGEDRTELWEPMEDPLALAVNLDVFPVDELPSSKFGRGVQSQVLRLLRWAVELRYIAAERGRDWHHPLVISLAKPVLGLLPVETLVSALTRAARRGRGTGDRVGVRVGSFDWSVPASDLGTPTELPFEDLNLLVPENSDAVLTAIYGDYRQLPPEAERTSHHAFTATWRGVVE